MSEPAEFSIEPGVYYTNDSTLICVVRIDSDGQILIENAVNNELSYMSPEEFKDWKEVEHGAA